MQSLTEHQFATRTPGKRVDVLVRVPGAETRKNHFPAIGTIISVGVFQVHQVGALAQINPAMPQGKTGRHIKFVCKDCFFIGPAITIGIFQDQQFVVRHIVRFQLRIGPRTQHPQSPPRVEADRNRIGHPVALVGKEIHLKAVVHLEGCHFTGRRNILLRFLNALPQRGCGHRSKKHKHQRAEGMGQHDVQAHSGLGFTLFAAFAAFAAA